MPRGHAGLVEKTCTFEGCDRPHMGRGLCSTHYAQWYRGEELRPIKPHRRTVKPKAPCSFPGCERVSHGNGLCNAHRSQQLKGQELRPIRTERAHRLVTKDGYVKVYDPDHPNAQKRGWVLEHVKVMSDVLGRPIGPKETVHHRNGIRDDNRPENLELWSSRHPKGQRVEDLVEFANEILELYGPTHDIGV